MHKMMLIFLIMISSVSLYLLPQHDANAQSETGSVKIFVHETMGDKVPSSGLAVNLYDITNGNHVSVRNISTVYTNPFLINSLPTGHKYLVGILRDGITASMSYLEINDKKTVYDDVGIETEGKIRIEVLANDGYTQLQGAKVVIKDNFGNTIASDITDQNGRTLRFSLQPTTLDGNYYSIEVSLGSNAKYIVTPINLSSTMSRDIRVQTPWPVMMDNFIVKLGGYQQNEGQCLAKLRDSVGNLVSDSYVDTQGEAKFNSLKTGENYLVSISNLRNSKEWTSSYFTIDGLQNFIIIR